MGVGNGTMLCDLWSTNSMWWMTALEQLQSRWHFELMKLELLVLELSLL